MSFKSVAFFCVLACLVLITEAQLTFTSSWGGKRAAGAGVTGTVNCRNEEAIANIYKLIQGEAEKFLFCQRT